MALLLTRLPGQHFISWPVEMKMDKQTGIKHGKREPTTKIVASSLTPIEHSVAYLTTRFRRQIDANVDTEGRPRSEPPRMAPRPDQSNSPEQNRLRRDERILLDIWTTENFYLLAAILSLVLLITLLWGIGPLPSDSRCTLPIVC
jgi:hypothetical protein